MTFLFCQVWHGKGYNINMLNNCTNFLEIEPFRSAKVHLNSKLADKYTPFLANWLAKVHINTV